MNSSPSALGAVALLMLLPAGAGGQNTGAPAESPVGDERAGASTGYMLGPEDVISVRALDAEEISDKPVRVDLAGYVRLPLVGRIRAAGLTVDQLGAELKARLQTYIRNPDVSVSITEFRSQPVSVIGSVKSPGIHQLQGRKTLIEVLSLAGGLATDAGYTIKVTRKLEWGRIPLPNATDDPTGQFSVADVKLRSLLNATNPAQNVIVCPNDVISVPRADMVYVVGQVARSGGFVLNERESMSVLQALSLAGGLGTAASPQNAKLLRVTPGDTGRTELRVDLKKLLAGTAEDLAMKSDDILFVPSSTPKKAALRAAEAAIQLCTGVLIWH